jgi:hypothetical protein
MIIIMFQNIMQTYIPIYIQVNEKIKNLLEVNDFVLNVKCLTKKN